MTGAQTDTLVALVENGPLWDGDVPSKAGRDDLIAQGLAVRVVMRLQDGYTAATQAGAAKYKEIFGNEDTLEQAKAFRKASNAITRASHRPTAP